MRVYSINKGVNRPVMFRGLTAQYIWWLGGGIAVLLFVLAILYILLVPLAICLVLVLGGGGILFMVVYRMSRKYGVHGMMKRNARLYLPKCIRGNIVSRTNNVSALKRR